MTQHHIESFGKPRELIAHKFAAGTHVVSLPMDGMVQDRLFTGAETILVFAEWTLTLPTVRSEIPVGIAADEPIGPRVILGGRQPKPVIFRDGTEIELPVWLMPHDEQRQRTVTTIQALLARPGAKAEPRPMLSVNGQTEPVFCSWATSLGADAVLYCIETHERRYSLAIASSVAESPRRLIEIRADGRLTFANGVTHTAHPRGRPMTENPPTDLQALRHRLWQIERIRTPSAGRDASSVPKAV